ncbi:MAG: IS21 family transposase [bacterium]|nr:IS21 family transposase [bacterium]
MERLSMRKVKEVLRLKWGCGLSNREIAVSLAIAPSTVWEYLRRAGAAGLAWPLPEALTEEQLEAALFAATAPSGGQARPLPDWPALHQELRRKGVTLVLLWQEYKAAHPDGYQYTQFCERYRQWVGALDVCLRQDYKAGEKLFVDWAGQTATGRDPAAGRERQAEIFVAVLGASNYTYVEATWTQGLPDWIGAHIRAFEAFGGVADLLVPDNLKAGVTAPNYYEPDLNPTYLELARHYGTAVVPARVRRPRDKAKVETGVQNVERQILAPLRHRTFFSLAELNQALRERVAEHNARPFQKLPGSRRSLFETLEKPALKPLPPTRYEFATWKKAQVHIDYHVEVEGHYYSVPYQLVRQKLDVRLTATTVECFHQGRRVAGHPRSFQKGRHTTTAEHMPRSHREYLAWTPERLVRWAAKSGPATAGVVKTILESRPHPLQGYRSCLGLMRLGKLYGPERQEAACARARAIGAVSYRSVESILKRGLDRLGLPEKAPPRPALEHTNVRGAQYYADAPTTLLKPKEECRC